MTVTKSTTIKDMKAGEVADGTREWFRVTSDADVLAAVDAWDAWVLWDEYNSDQAAWNLANPDDDPPPKFPKVTKAEVADRKNITLPECWFVELRFFAAHTNNEPDKAVNVGWVQVKANVTTSAGFFGDLVAVFNALRAMTPYAPAA